MVEYSSPLTRNIHTKMRIPAFLRWMPPVGFKNAAVQACQAAGVGELHDICPISALGALCGKALEIQDPFPDLLQSNHPMFLCAW